MPGTRAATQSSRRGSRPYAPCAVSTTMLATSDSSANISKGSNTLSVIDGMHLLFGGLLCGLGLGRGLGACLCLGGGFIHRADHVQRALGQVHEFVGQDALAAVQRVLQADELALQAGEL